MTSPVATLGGPNTFAGRATAAFVERVPGLVPPTYRSSMGELWEDLRSGRAEVIVLSSDSTRAGPGDSVRRILRFPAPVHVIAELIVPYRCSLLAQPATRLEDISVVLGHGSARQCRPFLDRHLPHAEIKILHDLNSEAAAQLVAEGDGRSAVVGTPEAGEAAGLVELAADIDEGAVGLWWAISRVSRHTEEPRRLVVRARFSGGGELGGLASELAARGFSLATAFSVPGGDRLFEYDYLLTFNGAGTHLATVQAQLERFPGTFLIAALDPPAQLG